MRKKIVGVLAGLALVLGFTLAVAAPASAAYSECSTSNSVCLFQGSGGGDPLLIYFTAGSAGACLNVNYSGIENLTHSAYNRMTAHSVTYYSNANCGTLHDIACLSGYGPYTQPASTTVTFAGAGVCGVGGEISSLRIN